MKGRRWERGRGVIVQRKKSVEKQEEECRAGDKDRERQEEEMRGKVRG